MSKTFAVVFAIALWWAVPSMSAEATQEKCTCDTKPGAVQDNGAFVNNAVACWSREDVEREWCTISIQSIEGDTRHQTIIGELDRLQDDPEQLTAFLQEQEAETVADPSTVEFAQARAELPALMENNSKLAAACVEWFFKHKEGNADFDGIEEGPFSCRIGEATGWLRMSFQVGEVRFVFMIAPDA